MLRATLKSLLARKLRLVLSGLAVVLGVMFVSGAFVLTDTLGRSFDAVFSTAYSEVDVAVSAKPKVAVSEFEGEQVAANFPASTVDKIRSVPGVATATGVISADGARVIGTNGKVVTSFGPPQLGGNWTGDDELVELRSGRGPTRDDEIAVNATVAEAAKIKVGDRVGVLTLAPKREFTLVGVFGYSGGRDSLGGVQEVMFTEPVAQQLMLGEKGVYNSVVVRSADGVAATALRDDIARALGDQYVVKTGEQLSDEASAGLKEGLAFFNNILLGFAGVALFVGIFLILNTFSIIVAQRTRELALMRAVGGSRRQIIGAVLVEAVVIGLIAALLGLGAGVGVGALLAYVFGQFGGGLELAPIGVPVAAVVSAFVVGVLVTVVAATLPALRASRIPPIAAMQDVATPDRPLTRLTVAGAAVAAVGGALLALGLSGNAGDNTLWTILGGVLVSFVGVALLTPLISKPVVALLGRIFSWSVPGKLGRLNSGRNPRRTAITAAALMVGIALVTGVTVILNSAKSSLTALAEETIQAELVISGAQTGPRLPSFDPAVLDRAAALPGVRVVAGLYGDMAMVGGERTYVTATSDVSALRGIYKATPTSGSIDRIGPRQLLVDAKTARERGVAVGSTLLVQLTRGEQQTYTVTGIYAESDLFGGFVVPVEAARDFAVPQPNLGYLQLDPGTPVDRVLPQVEALLADSPEVSVADRASFIEQQTGQFDQLLLMIQVLLALAILIAVLGIVNTLALSVLERTRELGLLRAIGLGRGATMWMVTVEAVVISVFGALLGVAVGTGLGAAVVRALRDQGITNLVLPWSQAAVFLVLAALVGGIAAVLPAIRAARLNVLGAIAHE
ncbi:putative ABC transport system permease protein [Micromonospora pattaloongensis]|uniref:Putative ABC transport system permease protein n=1 Tax=Micromonospora pattaloongensis TaxID=405436 RepID=A0A1H3P9B8_9ACTN|nr:ABC transporter permease [Micromonospora pattaloongensis]SDY97678.1 putative ABC transport system permease protein [Micromonospora pattaloongensis]